MVLTVFITAKEKINHLLSDSKSNHCVPTSPPLHVLAKQAKVQLQLAQAYFENVSDPELVDYAINNLEAAEKRYNYLLKQIREQ